jgi:hypothetical protein
MSRFNETYEEYDQRMTRKYDRIRERKRKRKQFFINIFYAMKNLVHRIHMYILRVGDDMHFNVYEREHLYDMDKCKKWQCRFFMILLTPIKLIHMFGNFLNKSRFFEVAFLMCGVGGTSYMLYVWLAPFDERWKTVIALAYVIVGITAELMLFLKVWQCICKFLLCISDYGNVFYNGYRDRLRNENRNYSMGLEEESRVGISYFIRKNKPDKEIMYIKD